MDRKKIRTKLINKLTYNESLYKLSFERKGIYFVPGQHISLGLFNNSSREYSIASDFKSNTIDVLIRRIQTGNVSIDLTNLKIGDEVELGCPIGYFTINVEEVNDTPIYLMATGSGIAPFLSMTKSFNQLKFNLIHGVKTISDGLFNEIPSNANYTLCTSTELYNGYIGRITKYIRTLPINHDSLFFLCGNSSMILDMYRFLLKSNIPRKNIRYEEYY